MKNNFSLKNHFMHNFFFYIGASLIAGASLSYGINMRLAAKDYEKFSIFIVSEDLKMKDFKDDVQEVLGESIIELNVYRNTPNSIAYDATYRTQGWSSDIMILPKERVYDEDVISYLDLPEEYQTENSYKVGDKVVGLEMYNGVTGHLTNYITYDESEYYLFINPDSVHLNGINDKQGKTDSVNKVLRWMINV